MEIMHRIEKLRNLMEENGIAAYIIPSSDPHNSEIPPDHWQLRKWISGFTGSAGIVIVTKEKAGLWTDGRYHIQAERELKNSNISLFKLGLPGVENYTDWLKNELKENDIIGLNGYLFTKKQVTEMITFFQSKKITIKYDFELVESIYEDRPVLPRDRVKHLSENFTGKSTEQKLNDIRTIMKEKRADAYLLTSLDEIAWLFNYRGSDIPYSPVAVSYAFITLTEAYIFIEKVKLSLELKDEFERLNISVMSYKKADSFIRKYKDIDSILIDPATINYSLYESLNKRIEKIEEMSPVKKIKACKNSVETSNLRETLIKDCVALTKFLYWLDRNIHQKVVTEFFAEKKLETFRENAKGYVSPGFRTISAYGANAAMMHYKAQANPSVRLEPKGMYLIDSGGHYHGGTTDITRTVYMGSITDEEKTAFTLVLKSLINLSGVVFLKGTTGANLDILARQPMWQRHLDYKCGTGHGVGYYLNVHEGPQNFSQAMINVPFEPGMVTTVEPGIYIASKYGVRTENMLLTIEDEKNEWGEFYRFETLSYCPIDRRLIKREMLNEAEIKWINDYHKKTYGLINPHLAKKESLWLKEMTANI